MSRLLTASIAVACGAAGACLYLAMMLGTPGGLLLVYMTQLPLFIAGLWLGAGAAALAGLAGTLVLLAASDLMGAALFAAVNAVPVTVLVREALLARPNKDGGVLWYPPGLLVAWLTGFALVGISAAVVFFGGPQGLQAGLHTLMAEVLERLASRPIANREQAAAALGLLIPGLLACSWMAMSVINAALAQGLLVRFGANWRPSPDLASLGLPRWLPVALGIAAAAVVYGGGLGFIGLNTLIALSVPFCLAGLAVLHAASRRLSNPAMALTCFYVMAGVLGWPFLAVALLGFFESWLGLRRRLAPKGASSNG